MPQPGVFICPTSDILPAVASLEYELLSLSLPLPLQYAAKHATPQPQPRTHHRKLPTCAVWYRGCVFPHLPLLLLSNPAPSSSSSSSLQEEESSSPEELEDAS
jgi:hypothetical protein